mmetsp:Transcript_75755/g.239583  ORF Transcript_75755/g.239583 Transcript_75755/m.239583 type:complete len:238 (-) Transcript_75755:1164-1877(-)
MGARRRSAGRRPGALKPRGATPAGQRARTWSWAVRRPTGSRWPAPTSRRRPTTWPTSSGEAVAKAARAAASCAPCRSGWPRAACRLSPRRRHHWRPSAVRQLWRRRSPSRRRRWPRRCRRWPRRQPRRLRRRTLWQGFQAQARCHRLRRARTHGPPSIPGAVARPQPSGQRSANAKTWAPPTPPQKHGRSRPRSRGAAPRRLRRPQLILGGVRWPRRGPLRSSGRAPLPQPIPGGRR